MRQRYLFAVIPVSFLAGLWVGFTLPEDRQPTEARSNPVEPPPQYVRMVEQDAGITESRVPDPHLSVRMDTIHAELRDVRAALDELSTNLHTYAASRGNTNTNGGVVTYAPDEIADFQNTVFAQLADPSFNLDKLNGMPEFQKLPEADMKLVLDEVARRLDSGEISKSTFLPGYSPSSE